MAAPSGTAPSSMAPRWLLLASATIFLMIFPAANGSRIVISNNHLSELVAREQRLAEGIERAEAVMRAGAAINGSMSPGLPFMLDLNLYQSAVEALKGIQILINWIKHGDVPSTAADQPARQESAPDQRVEAQLAEGDSMIGKIEGALESAEEKIESVLATAQQKVSDTIYGHQQYPIPAKHPGNGGCAFHDVDNYKEPTEDTCYLLMYRCSFSKKENHPTNHNAGDIAWALSDVCKKYGKYLYIYEVEVARAWMYRTPCWDGGFLYCHGTYELCNTGKYGAVCGCGTHGESCGPDPEKRGTSSTNFGWRTVPDFLHPSVLHPDFNFCPCAQYSLPSRGQGNVDPEKTADYIERRGWDKRAEAAPFQWKHVGKAWKVDIKKCLDKHVFQEGQTLTDAIAKFKRAVLEHGEPKDCKVY